MPLRYLDCVVVLGICPLRDLFPQEEAETTTIATQHQCDLQQKQQLQKQIQLSPLLDGKTVFQTADGTTRIYLMPYSKKKNEYMWQLSFPVADEGSALDLSRRGSRALKEEALRRCRSWHAPIPEILNATPFALVSGYPVYDRDILTADVLAASRRGETAHFSTTTTNVATDAEISAPTTTHPPAKNANKSAAAASSLLPITLLGDAAHPMSPFKGQGANQALLDALSLARALHRIRCREGRTLEEALECFENEMVDRSAQKVKASSEAARFLHTEVAIREGNVTRGAAAAAVKSK